VRREERRKRRAKKDKLKKAYKKLRQEKRAWAREKFELEEEVRRLRQHNTELTGRSLRRVERVETLEDIIAHAETVINGYKNQVEMLNARIESMVQEQELAAASRGRGRGHARRG
jgi:chromosome segregation ATPase